MLTLLVCTVLYVLYKAFDNHLNGLSAKANNTIDRCEHNVHGTDCFTCYNDSDYFD